ncbi:MAG: hypothetical protein A3G52_01185 [Candidatus Taylorbacteria bacterium RIFCSPLOWO2_12_FULL_43_20]|uniref:Uncharacterized protein n=1 Tax=Candidatus Taylorbacteria bacterium RIFCSPLOWO2_12_FULL_43_20 TaxID=1802332 RepID=A0A1G2P5E8_9BACT|nr:MAG: hypothetical protein A2825_00580 [Candidatus Taylorbacteria bacterium RIFCSPHIGHO2_01_FULL_43_120]OHA22308.1 MAG: hypothetical protein A3B98_04305 [Candidatus Taylorbacteria bacterium RIFCSPHIGHO2_02_FULL_43_55]OHA30036.1 MAG: hypothetical protein A3E92_03270 [Candidatus Taylorbacteria bacterium RIFCSPHIGHO2_12_FULL_42_34]OHA30434.1 MAG: hypothetical protein A3B09_04330 [Candidatus Taylorbacteria bacterium RIFCSPLOWO2_01_FULL_43_83]OHA39516.1 MAG: hypothetical protein A3H58_02565 [Candi
MKKIKITIIITVMFFTGALALSQADAHVDDASGSQSTDKAVTKEEFAQMEDVMLKMMNGEDLNDAEAGKMVNFMKDHHFSDNNFMMGGYSGGQSVRTGYGIPMMSGMMNGLGGSVYSSASWLFFATVITWLFVGILLAIYIIKKLKQ